MLASQKAARVWLGRRDVEIEAASLFAAMSRAMSKYNWPADIVEAAFQAAEDERVHARLCQELVDTLDPKLRSPPLAKEQVAIFNSQSSLLYTVVSVGCVTESMSCALLLEMQERTTHPDCKRVVSHVLRDEIMHSRIGWESLRFVAEREKVNWLEEHVANMCHAARSNEIHDFNASELSSFGVLPPEVAKRILSETEAQVIYPGLATFGVRPAVRNDCLIAG